MQFKSFQILILAIFFQACGGGGDEVSSRSPSSSNDVSKDKAPAPPTGVQAQAIDPLFEHSWHLENTGQRSFATTGGLIGRDINVKDVYENNIFGRQVKVAVSDNGVEISHPDLWFNHLSGESRDYSGAPSTWLRDPYPTASGENDAHGTSVAGIISATRNNGLGSHGVAPSSAFAGFLFVGAPYSEAKYIDQAQGNFDIFNYSYGRVSCRFTILPEAYIAQLRYGVEVQRNGKGSLYVKAAGNEYVGPRSDCLPGSESYYFGNANLEHDQSTPYVIAVAALNARGDAASYSSPGSSLWVSAPGGEYGSSSPAIVTTDLQGCNRGLSNSDNDTNNFEKGSHQLNSGCDYTSTMNGTSSAAPVVSGVIALILEANPHLTWREVKHILAATAKKVDPLASSTSHPYQGEYNLPNHTYQYGWLTNAAGYHFHNWYGFGGVDTKKAVEAAINYDSPFGPFIQREVSSGSLNITIPDRDATGAEHMLVMNEQMYIETVQLRVTVEHGYASDLGIEIESPSGMKSRLLNINSGIVEADLQDSLLLTNAFYGEQAQGQWKIRLWDGAVEDEGQLKNWKLTFFGHKGSESHERDQVSTTSTNNGSLLSGVIASSTQESSQLNARSAAQTNLKDISANRRTITGTATRSTTQIQMNSASDSAPLSELLSWPEMKENQVRRVYSAKDKVAAITSEGSQIVINLFEKDQLQTRKKFDANSMIFKTAAFFQSMHHLVFFTKQGDLEVWQFDENFKKKKTNYSLKMKNLEAKINLVEDSRGASIVIEDQEFFHTLILSNNGQVERLSPRPLIDSTLSTVFSDKEGRLNAWISFEDKLEVWNLIDGQRWGLQSSRAMNSKMVNTFLLSTTNRFLGVVPGEGIEKELGTFDLFIQLGEIENTIRHPGDEKLVFATELSNQEIIVFGHTNGSFKQSNFGEWDLFGVVFDKNAQEKKRWHWGREQKTISSSSEQKLHYAQVSELPEGRLVRLWYAHDDELRMIKFYLDDEESAK